MMVVVAFTLHARIWEEGSTNHFLLSWGLNDNVMLV